MQRSLKSRTRLGFTLIELVTVVAILGIVAAFVGVPAMSNLAAMRSGAAASRMSSDVRYIQRMAMSSGLRTWMSVNVGASRYQLYIEDANNLGKANRIALASPSDLSTAAVQFNTSPYGSVTITSAAFNSTSELEFDNFGAPRDGNSAVLTSAGVVVLSNGVAVRVQPVGGMVEHLRWP